MWYNESQSRKYIDIFGYTDEIKNEEERRENEQ